jgi:hypothetical protein
LSILCDTIRRDVLGDDLRRKTAFELAGDESTGETGISDGISPDGYEDDFETEGDDDYIKPIESVDSSTVKVQETVNGTTDAHTSIPTSTN